MTDFKTIKHFNCSLDFNLTHLLTVWVMSSTNAFLEEVNFFHWRFDDIDVESASKYVAGKHRILTTMNISGSRVMYIVMVVSSSSIGLTFIVHLKIISKLKAGSVPNVWTRTPSWLLSISGVIRISMRVIKLTNGKPSRCYYTCGYMIFMTWVISLNNLTVMW